MNERIISLTKYNEIFDENSDSISNEYMHYSFVPLEIEYLESLRKRSNIQISSMKKFCSSLDNINTVQRIPLVADDIAEALIDPEFEKELLGQKINPYRLSTITTIRHHAYRWWSDEIYEQYRELYD